MIGAVISVAIIVAVLLLGAVLHPPAAPVTLVQAGTVWLVLPGHYEQVTMQFSASAWLSGSTTGTALMQAYLLDAGELRQYVQLGTSSAAYWSSGQILSISWDVNLASGTYYLVFASVVPTASLSVQVTAPIVASPS